MKNKIILSIATIGIGFLTGCTSTEVSKQTPREQVYANPYLAQRLPSYESPSPEKQERFDLSFRNVAYQTKADRDYRRIGLKSAENKKWFKKITYMLWDRQIGKTQYVREGLKRFPMNDYEFKFISSNIDGNQVKYNSGASE